MHTVQRWKHS